MAPPRCGEPAVVDRLAATLDLQMRVVLRRYRPEDSLRVKQLIRRVWTEHFGTHPEALVREYMNQPETLADIDSEVYAEPTGTFLVAEDQARLLGCAAVCRVTADVCEVRRMYVLPEGRRQGLGRRLLGELLVFASKAGYRSIRLTTNKALTASHRLYESAGFALAESWDTEAEGYVHFYVRPLAPAEPERA